MNWAPGGGLRSALFRVQLFDDSLRVASDLADEPLHVGAVQREGGPGQALARPFHFEAVPPREERRKIDDTAAEDRPELLLQVGPVPELGHEDAEEEVVAEGAEHEAVLVAVGLAQVVQESGGQFNENFFLA